MITKRQNLTHGAILVIAAAAPSLMCSDEGSSRTAVTDAPATTPSAELRNVKPPEFETRLQLQEYIEKRHARLNTFAEQQPNTELSAAVTFASALSAAQTDTLFDEYGVSLVSISYQTERRHGVTSLFGATTAQQREAKMRMDGALSADERLTLTHVRATAQAADLVGLARDERVALVYADHSIDRVEGNVPENVVFFELPDIFDAYQSLASTP